MGSTARGVLRFLRPRRERIAPPPAADYLDEFAPEHTTMPAPRPRTARATVPWRRIVLVGTAAASIFVVASLVARRDTNTKPRSIIAPAASPIEVEFPEYPGAPLLRTAAAAVPARLTPDVRVEQTSASAEPRAATAATANPRQAQSRSQLRPVASGLVMALEARDPFDVRGPVPQVVSARAAEPALSGSAVESTSADAPPRRIGPPLTLTAVGGTVTRNARLELVLEVTEHGDVARVVANEAVDVHPDMIESIAAAARAWRYEPARRDGVRVPARVRVVVQLGGGN